MVAYMTLRAFIGCTTRTMYPTFNDGIIHAHPTPIMIGYIVTFPGKWRPTHPPGLCFGGPPGTNPSPCPSFVSHGELAKHFTPSSKPLHSSLRPVGQYWRASQLALSHFQSQKNLSSGPLVNAFTKSRVPSKRTYNTMCINTVTIDIPLLGADGPIVQYIAQDIIIELRKYKTLQVALALTVQSVERAMHEPLSSGG